MSSLIYKENIKIFALYAHVEKEKYLVVFMANRNLFAGHASCSATSIQF